MLAATKSFMIAVMETASVCNTLQDYLFTEVTKENLNFAFVGDDVLHYTNICRNCFLQRNVTTDEKRIFSYTVEERLDGHQKMLSV
jgi:hypothetical protein